MVMTYAEQKMNEAQLIDHAKRTNSNLIRLASCRKCRGEVDRGKDRCGYCHLTFEFIVKATAAINAIGKIPS